MSKISDGVCSGLTEKAIGYIQVRIQQMNIHVHVYNITGVRYQAIAITIARVYISTYNKHHCVWSPSVLSYHNFHNVRLNVRVQFCDPLALLHTMKIKTTKRTLLNSRSIENKTSRLLLRHHSFKAVTS